MLELQVNEMNAAGDFNIGMLNTSNMESAL